MSRTDFSGDKQSPLPPGQEFALPKGAEDKRQRRGPPASLGAGAGPWRAAPPAPELAGVRPRCSPAEPETAQRRRALSPADRGLKEALPRPQGHHRETWSPNPSSARRPGSQQRRRRRVGIPEPYAHQKRGPRTGLNRLPSLRG